jgi:hypothetical protein
MAAIPAGRHLDRVLRDASEPACEGIVSMPSEGLDGQECLGKSLLHDILFSDLATQLGPEARADNGFESGSVPFHELTERSPVASPGAIRECLVGQVLVHQGIHSGHVSAAKTRM